MKIEELNALRNKIKLLNILNIVFLIFNLFLIIIPFYHYWADGFNFDLYFIIITILNIIGFYLSYIISYKLVFFKSKHRHFNEKLKNKQ